jgi:hypothetical protein
MSEPSYCLHPTQQLQILALPTPHFEAFLKSWNIEGTPLPTVREVCNMKWKNSKDMDLLLAALHKENIRFWILEATRHFPQTWRSMFEEALGKNVDILEPSVTLQQLEHLRDLMWQCISGIKMPAAAAPKPVRFPLPVDVRQALIMLSTSSYVSTSYQDLVTRYCELEYGATVPPSWSVNFPSQEQLLDFVERVTYVERTHWKFEIAKRIKAYPLPLWKAFYEFVRIHFGANITKPEWSYYGPIGSVRLSARLLEIHNLAEVEKILRTPSVENTTTNTTTAVAVASVSCEAREVREARFLTKLMDMSDWVLPMMTYMGCEKKGAGIRTIAQKIQENTDTALFDEWETILNQRDPQHIISKVVACRDGKRMAHSQQCVLDGLASMDTVTSVDHDSWFITLLKKWKELPVRQQVLVHAFLDEILLQKEKK